MVSEVIDQKSSQKFELQLNHRNISNNLGSENKIKFLSVMG